MVVGWTRSYPRVRLNCLQNSRKEKNAQQSKIMNERDFFIALCVRLLSEYRRTVDLRGENNFHFN